MKSNFLSVKTVSTILETCSLFIRNHLPYLVLIVCVWLAHFLFSDNFGFYEDDLSGAEKS
jgi:hypothetical protein